MRLLMVRWFLAAVCGAFAVNYGWSAAAFWIILTAMALVVPFFWKSGDGGAIGVLFASGVFASWKASGLDFDPDFGQGPDVDGNGLIELVVGFFALIGAVGWGWVLILGGCAALYMRHRRKMRHA